MDYTLQNGIQLFLENAMTTLNYQLTHASKHHRCQQMGTINHRLIREPLALEDFTMTQKLADKFVVIDQVMERVTITSSTLLHLPHHQNLPHVHI